MRRTAGDETLTGVKLQEDWQILYGDGIGDHMTGLTNTPGIQACTGLATDPRTAQIRRAITRVWLAYFEASGLVTHPLDWENHSAPRGEGGHHRRTRSGRAAGCGARAGGRGDAGQPPHGRGRDRQRPADLRYRRGPGRRLGHRGHHPVRAPHGARRAVLGMGPGSPEGFRPAELLVRLVLR